MTIFEIIQLLHSNEIKVFSKNGKLSIDAPKGAITPEILSLLKNNKQKLIDYIRDVDEYIPEITRVDRNTDLKLSYAQKRLWFLDQMDEGSAHYNTPGVIKIKGDFKVACAQETFKEIIQRHEPLRTVFIDSDNGPFQIIREQFEFSIKQIDLTKNFSEKKQLQRIDEIIQRDTELAFDLTDDLMLRVSYIQLRRDEGLLMLNIHHIATDGWSMGIFIDEFVKLYTCNLTAKPSPLQALEIQYVDYAYWQQKWLSGHTLNNQLEYWDKQLADLPLVHSLPLDFERPQYQGYNGAAKHFKIDSQNLQKLKKLAKDKQATLFMVIHAAVSILLSRYSHNNDIVIGTTVANRRQEELEGLIGFFVNTLVLRSDCSNNPTFIEFLELIKKTNLDAQTYQDVPFELIVDRINPTRSTSHNTLFQVMLSMNTNESIELVLPEVSLAVQSSKTVSSKFDLSIYASGDEELELIFEYNTDLFTKKTIKRLSDGLEILLTAIASDATQRIAELPVLSQQESQYLLHTLNNTQVDYPKDFCIHELFEQQAGKTPENTAVVYKNQKLTYCQLNEKANQIAHYLIQQGVKPDDFVGLCVERSLEMMVALLAILKAGGAYLPLDPSYPQERLQHMLSDSQVKIMLTQKQVLNELVFIDQKVICIDQMETFKDYSNANIDKQTINLKTNNLAYIIYTSGSTGKPKGAAVEHRNETNLLYWYRQNYAITAEDKVLILTAVGFDLTQKNFFAPLISGASVQFATARFFDVNIICDFIVRQKISFTNCAPSIFYPLVEHESNIKKLASLRCVLFGGEAIAFDRLNNWLNNVPDSMQLINMYGPTECTDISCAYQIPVKANNSNVPIGTPNANVELYVLNNYQQLVPLGVAGELCVGGLGVSRGYLNQPQLTDEKFIKHPFSNDDNQKIYRTGDLVRWNKASQLEFIGRIDSQIKIRGFRVELGEIEATLNKLSHINQSVVIYDPDKQQLTAYLVTIDNQAPDIAELRAEMKKSVPDYMLPNSFVLIEELPLTSHGKIDKKALTGSSLSEQARHYLKPEGKIETTLVQIWSKLLIIPKAEISADANFFEVGGHSLLSIRLLAEIRAKCARELSVRDIFENAQLSQLALLINTSNTLVRPDIRAIKRDAIQLIPSYAQQRLWFINQMDKTAIQYNMPSAMHLKGNFRVDVAQRAFSEIIERHEILRTKYIDTENGLKQVIQKQFKFNINEIDLSHTVDIKSAVEEQIKKNNQQIFNLSKDLMLRVNYLYLNDNEAILLFNMHHIATDGWSIGILVNEFVQLYTVIVDEKENSLIPLTIQYADYAHWQRRWLSGDVLDKQLNYWHKQLANIPQLHSLTLDFDRPEFQTFNGARYDFKLDNAVLESLQTILSENQVTLFMMMHAAFSILLSRYSGSTDILIGTPVANRMQKELEGLIGFFVNTLILRADCSKNLSFIDFLAQIKNTNLDAQANQDVPFEHLVDRLNPSRSTSHNALFQIMLSMDTNQSYKFKLPQVDISSLPDDQLTAKFDLSLYVIEGDELAFTFEYNTDLFTEKTIKRLSDGLETLLTAIASDVRQNIAELPVLNKQENHYLIHSLNDTQVDYPTDLCIHEIFEQQVEKTPDNVAVVYEDQELTYRQLNQQANQLAHYLLEQGVKPDDFVGLCAERSLEMMIALFAILKAGGAYLPLDPSYPQERLLHMLSDSQVKIMLTQKQILNELAFTDQKAICIDQVEIFKDYSNANIDKQTINLKTNNLAYIIYTSGSTGKPKGAAVEHRNETNLLYWYRQNYAITTEDKVLILTAIGFDLTQKNFFAPLISGASVQFATARFFDVNIICDFIAKQKISFTNCAPSVFYPLVEHEPNIKKLTSLRCVLFGGEAIAFDRLNNWLNNVPDNMQLINMYGPTECTDISCAYQIPIKANNNSAPIGTANANVELYVLNNYQQLVPHGVAGELCIGGFGVSRGYLNQPQLTAEKFIKHPFSNDNNQKIYRTGDLVKWNKNSKLEFIGRIDNQIKIRGFRVELGEIESILNNQPYINQSVVIYDPDKQQLTGYLVTTDNKIPDIAELRVEIKKSLPIYMLPNSFVLIEELPLTSHGKIDKKALTGPSLLEQAMHYLKPQGEIEKTLTKIWSKLLNIPKAEISADANFFELGGHSLLLTNMLHQIIEQLDVQLEVKDIFHSPTVCDIAQAIKAQTTTDIHLLTKQDNTQPLPLSYGQYRIWFIEQLKDQTNEHNIAIAVKIKGIFKVEILQQALNAMIKQHDILRTKIIVANNIPMQVVEPCYTYDINCIDLSHLSESDRQHEISHLSYKHDTQVFDLTQLPLLSALLLKTGQQEYLLHFNQHHIISDGWSQQLFYSELMSHYQKIHNKQKIEFKLDEFNYADYAVWQQQWLESETIKQQRVFWKDYLKNCNEQLSLPIQKSEGTLDGRQNLVEATLDSATRDKLKFIAHAHKGSLFNVLHSGFALLLCRLSGETDFNIGLPVTGRHIYGTQNMLGMFLNTLPIRHKLNLDTAFKDLLKQQIKNVEQVLSHQDLPLEQIFEVTQCDRNVESTPLFQILFNMLSVPESKVEDENSDFQMYIQETSEIENKFNITLYLKDTEQGLNLFCHYNSSAFSHQHIRNLIDQYLLLLSQIATDINKPCQSYALNKGDNKINYLRDLTSQINTEVKDVTALFRQQVLAAPEAIAIKDEFHSWSYQNLLNYSYGLALELKHAGVKRGDIVTIMASRQANLVGGILAVLQLGAAYSIVLDNMSVNRLIQHLQIVDNSITLFCEPKRSFNTDVIEKIESVSKINVIQNNPNHYPVLEDDFIPETNLLDLTASIIFTSGSSGIPKAVQGTHLGLSAYLNWLPEFAGFTNMDNFGMLSGLAHDPLQRDIFGALCNGATICIPSKQQFATYQLAGWMKQFEVSVMHLTPAMAEIIGMQAKINLDYLKVVFLTGEVLRRDTVAKLLQLNLKLRIFNCYGATETQRAATYFEITDIEGVPAVIPMSMSSKDTRLRLLTENNVDCGIGEIGMICTESNRIAKGYLNDDTLTQQRFVQAEKGLRRYHTGDLGVCLDGKTIKYLGRKDSQINIRGFRVELGEIEYQLSQYPNIRSCTTIVHKDQYIIAYVTTNLDLIDESVFIEQCQVYLQQHLADYMLPSSIVVLDEIPLTENRKVDKKALPNIDESFYSAEYHCPQGITETKLVAIWSQLLKLPEEKISVSANFFELGGHSLLLLKLITEIRQCFAIEVDLKYVFESKDLSSLADMLNPLIEQANISSKLANTAVEEIEEIEF